MTKILVSKGWGAGWSTWNDSDKRKEMAEYQPIIDFIEAGNDPALLKEDHPLVQQMITDLDIKGGIYDGGASNLCVEEVSGPYRIDEYDGNEYVTTYNDLWTGSNRYVIQCMNLDEDSGEALYWSNESGWVGLTDATVFSKDEREAFGLTSGALCWAELP